MFTDAYAGSTVCAPSRCALVSTEHRDKQASKHVRVRANFALSIDDWEAHRTLHCQTERRDLKQHH